MTVHCACIPAARLHQYNLFLNKGKSLLLCSRLMLVRFLLCSPLAFGSQSRKSNRHKLLLSFQRQVICAQRRLLFRDPFRKGLVRWITARHMIMAIFLVVLDELGIHASPTIFITRTPPKINVVQECLAINGHVSLSGAFTLSIYPASQIGRFGPALRHVAIAMFLKVCLQFDIHVVPTTIQLSSRACHVAKGLGIPVPWRCRCCSQRIVRRTSRARHVQIRVSFIQIRRFHSKNSR